MAMSCPIGFDAKRLREQVSGTCERVAADPPRVQGLETFVARDIDPTCAPA